MEKKLLLLGILRNQEMHGYQLNEMLSGSVGIPISLTKPNAYKLLNQMESDGWVTFRIEQEGNRPPRRVYQVTDAGEIAFHQMLRDSMSAYIVPEFPSSVIFNFLDLLPAGEAVAFLQGRREKILTCFEEVAELPVDIRKSHPGVDYLIRFYQFDLKWLDEIILKLSES